MTTACFFIPGSGFDQLFTIPEYTAIRPKPAEHLRNQINEGVLKNGTKLPGCSTLRSSLGVGKNTILAALAWDSLFRRKGIIGIVKRYKLPIVETGATINMTEAERK